MIEELKLGLTGLVTESSAARVGQVVGARVLFLSKITGSPSSPEVLIKLVRVETAEVLAVSLLKLSRKAKP